MQKLPRNIYDDVCDTNARMYGYEPCKKAEALKPVFDDATFYEVDEGQTLRFYTESQLESMFEREQDPKEAGPGSIVQIVDMGGGMWRFYTVFVPGKRGYQLTST